MQINYTFIINAIVFAGTNCYNLDSTYIFIVHHKSIHKTSPKFNTKEGKCKKLSNLHQERMFQKKIKIIYILFYFSKFFQIFLPKLLFKFSNQLLTNYIPYILPSLTNQNVSLTLRHVDV